MVARIKTWIAGEVLTDTDLNAEFNNIITAQNTVATSTSPGPSELATAAEISAATDATRTITPDAFGNSRWGEKNVGIACFAPTTDCATGDGKGFFPASSSMIGMNLTYAQLGVATAGVTGTMDIQVRRVRAGVPADMFSTKPSIASGGVIEAAGQAINLANDDIALGDRIFIDVDTVHTTPAKGLVVVLNFNMP
jgi:hypothetical protein